MAVQILRDSHLIPKHIRRLVYASLILSLPTLAFSLAADFGFMSLWLIPAATGCTWIYHLVLIILHSKSITSSSTHELRWETNHALGWGYIIAILWTGATIMLGTSGGLDPWMGIWYQSPAWAFSIVDFVFALGSTGVMWALMGVSTHLKRTSRLTLQKRAGPREFVEASAETQKV